MNSQILGGIFLASHVVRTFVFGSADPVIVAQLEQLRFDVQAMARSILLQKSEVDVCDWKLWRSDVFLKLTVVFDVVLIACLVWWYCTSLPRFQPRQFMQPIALPGFGTSGSSDPPDDSAHPAGARSSDLPGLLLLAPAPAAVKGSGRPGRPSDFGLRPVA